MIGTPGKGERRGSKGACAPLDGVNGLSLWLGRALQGQTAAIRSAALVELVRASSQPASQRQGFDQPAAAAADCRGTCLPSRQYCSVTASWNNLEQQKTRNALQHAGFEAFWNLAKRYFAGGS